MRRITVAWLSLVIVVAAGASTAANAQDGPRFCYGQLATIIGTPEGEVIRGTPHDAVSYTHLTLPTKA